jgi:hypothetical protein
MNFQKTVISQKTKIIHKNIEIMLNQFDDNDTKINILNDIINSLEEIKSFTSLHIKKGV